MQLVEQLKAAVAHDDPERIRLVLELVGVTLDRKRGDGAGKAAAQQLFTRAERLPPMARQQVCVEMGALAFLADLATGGYLKSAAAVPIEIEERGPARGPAQHS